MPKRGLRTEPQYLVEGLTFDERLARLEGRVLGNTHGAGLLREHEEVRRRVEELESGERRRQMAWWVRWIVRRR